MEARGNVGVATWEVVLFDSDEGYLFCFAEVVLDFLDEPFLEGLFFGADADYGCSGVSFCKGYWREMFNQTCSSLPS